jgi:hypothetical protein
MRSGEASRGPESLFTTLPRYVIVTLPGDVAQLGERDNRTVEVRGSSPLISTSYYTIGETKARSRLEFANRKHLWYSVLYNQSQTISDEQE